MLTQVPPEAPSLDQAQAQVSILLEEYRALRTDINGRSAAQANLLGFSLAN
jgi:hypothetical protein